MKTNVLTTQHGAKTAMLAALLFLMNTLSSAQIIKTYAASQANQTYGICIGCGVLNPENAVGSNENDYSTLLVPMGLLARTEQTLIFPTATTNPNKLVIGIGASEFILTARLLGGVSIETFNGNVSNNDYQNVNNDILKLGGSSLTKGEIELTVNKPYDRVKISLNSGLLNLYDGLRVYYAYQYKDPYINLLAHSQGGHITLGENIPLEGSEVALINTSGKEVYRSKLKSKTFESGQPEGIYILTLQTKEGKNYSKKIMIK